MNNENAIGQAGFIRCEIIGVCGPTAVMVRTPSKLTAMFLNEDFRVFPNAGLVHELEREIIRLNRDYVDLLRHHEMYTRAWEREIGGFIRAKHHQIDGFVLRTQDALREAEERGLARGRTEVATKIVTVGPGDRL